MGGHPKPTLAHKLSTIPTLKRAWSRLNKSNVDSFGLSGQTIRDFQSNLDPQLKLIQRDLRNQSFRFRPLRAYPAKKRDNPSAIRPIRIPEIRDRVVLSGIALLIDPYLRRRYKLNNPASYAYHRGLGPHQALRRMEELYQAGNPIVLEGDISKFFDTVPRDDLLEDYIFPVLPDPSLNDLIRDGLSMEIGNYESIPIMYRSVFQDSDTGIPQGNALSPLLSNVYLSTFDHEMIRKGFNLIRYADDFIILCATEDTAIKAYNLAKSIIEDKLKLKMHDLDNKSPKSKCRIVRLTDSPIEFLSVCYNGERLWVSHEKVQALKERITDATTNLKNANIISLMTSARNILTGWLSAFNFTDLKPYFVEIDNFINKQIAYCLRTNNWRLKRLKRDKKNSEFLSPEHRAFSGIPTCAEYLSRLPQHEPQLE